MLQFARLDGATGGKLNVSFQFFALPACIGSVHNVAISSVTHFEFLLSLNMVVLRSVTRIRFTSTLLALSMSIAMGIFWPETKPVTGNEKTACSGPDAQQKQQNVFSKLNTDGA